MKHCQDKENSQPGTTHVKLCYGEMLLWPRQIINRTSKVNGIIRLQYTAGLPDEMLQKVSPELWMLDWDLMKRPGNIEMQFELNCDYETNIKMFPVFHEYFRVHYPPSHVIWGKYDAFFDVKEALCYKKDLPDAQIHVIDGGHMALETNFGEVLKLVENFLKVLEAKAR